MNKTLSRTEKRTVIIGLDGVPYRLIKKLSNNGTMPETRKIIERGELMQMESSLPEISSVAWSSIITGKKPADHGIFGYTDIPMGTYRLSFPNYNNLKADPFWQRDAHKKSIIINVPSTFPVKPLNGIHISGFVSLDLERSVYPKFLIPKLSEFGYRIDVDSSKAHESLDMFLRDLDRTLKARIAAYRYLWKKIDWSTFMLVFTGSDRLSHFLWDAYESDTHKYHSTFLEHFHQIDQIIGEIADRISENDLLILLSDHGFELLEREVNINFLLREDGFLRFKPDSKRNLADIDHGTKAFALEPSRIYINKKNKYPRGSVDESEYDKTIEDLTTVFNDLEFNGKKVIKEIFRKEDIYQGVYMNQAPDLVLIPNKGFNLKANIKTNKLFEETVFTGKHTQQDAFLLVSTRVEKGIIPDKPAVSDVCSIIDKLKN